MKKKCSVCGHEGEITWRDGSYYCAMCGSPIDVTQPGGTGQDNLNEAGEIMIDATCPVCQNTSGNTFRNGKCHCSMCGTTFHVVTASNNTQFDASNSSSLIARRAELEEEKKKRLHWGILFIFLFWPVAIYHFCKMAEISEEISKL